MQPFHHLLMKAHTAMHKRIMTGAANHKLTAGQPKILEFLSVTGVADQKTIAQHCEIEPATVGSILGRMEESGLITRSREEGNRRSLFVTLTERGKVAAEQSEKLFREGEETALAGIDEKDRQLLCKLLDKVYHNLKDAEDKRDE